MAQRLALRLAISHVEGHRDHFLGVWLPSHQKPYRAGHSSVARRRDESLPRCGPCGFQVSAKQEYLLALKLARAISSIMPRGCHLVDEGRSERRASSHLQSCNDITLPVVTDKDRVLPLLTHISSNNTTHSLPTARAGNASTTGHDGTLSRHTDSGRSFHTAPPTRGFERKPPAVRLRPPHTGIVASHHSEKVTKPAVQRPFQVYTWGTSVRQFFKHVDVHGCAGEDGGVEERRETERERTEGCLCVYVCLRESLWFCGCPVSWSQDFRRTWFLHKDMGDCMTGCLKVGTVEQDSIRTNMPTPSHNTCRIETGRSGASHPRVKHFNKKQHLTTSCSAHEQPTQGTQQKHRTQCTRNARGTTTRTSSPEFWVTHSSRRIPSRKPVSFTFPTHYFF